MNTVVLDRSPEEAFDPKTSFFRSRVWQGVDGNDQKLATGDAAGEENSIFDFEGDSCVVDGAYTYGSFTVIET